MIIRTEEGGTPIFVLKTKNTAYAFMITPTGHPEHLYYGVSFEAGGKFPLGALVQKRTFAPGNTVVYSQDYPAMAMEDMCLEFSSFGKGDLREPFVEIVHSDGGRTCDFTFESARITDEKEPYEDLPGSYSADGKAEQLTVVYVDRQYSVTLETRYYVWEDCDCICRSSRVINSGRDELELDRLMSLQLDLQDGPYAVTTFHGAWAREMEKSTAVLTGGKLVNSSFAGCSSSRSNPFFMVHSPDASESAGDCYAFNLIYSGNHYGAVEVNSYGKTRIVSGINPQGFRFMIPPGECIEAPECVMTYTRGGFSGITGNMHSFVREHIVRGVWKDKPRPILLNSWEAMYFKIDQGSLISLAKAAARVGIELFVVDDGWFLGRNDDSHALGDWIPDPKKLPGGLESLGRKVRELGLSFGIWVEPEMVNAQSELYRAHPDWAMTVPGKPHSEGRNQMLLDLANPDVQDYLIDVLSGLFADAGISYVKWDFNRVFSDVYSPYLPAKRQGETAHRYVCGLYRVMRELTERFPDILFEGCASGGNRFDLGILSFFPQIWASDNTDAVSRVHIQEGYSFGYPLSTVGAHVSACPNHQTLREVPPDTRFNVAAFGILGYEYDIRDLSAKDRKEMQRQTSLYKEWRDVLQFGKFHRGRSGNVHEWTCVSPDRKRAVGMLFRELALPNAPGERFFAKGLDPKMEYRFYCISQDVDVRQFGSLINTRSPIHVRQGSLVHSAIAKAVRMHGETEDETVSGEVLMNAGIQLSQAFSGTGFAEGMRFFPDFSSRLYFMEAVGCIAPGTGEREPQIAGETVSGEARDESPGTNAGELDEISDETGPEE